MKNTLSIFFILFFSITVFGQSCQLFTTNSKLSSSLINKIYQDRNGMIWIATEDGLNKYDGVKFTVYKHKKHDEHSLCHNYVRALFEDSKGNLIVGTYKGVQMYDPGTDSFTPQAKWENGDLFDSTIITIIERKDGEIWVSGNILCKLILQKGELIVKKLNLPIAITSTDYMIEDKNRNIWITKGENGIYKISDKKKVTHYLKDEKGITIVDLCEDLNGNIYVGTMGKGLFVYDQSSDSFKPIPYKGKLNLPIKSLYPDNQNELYIGTDGKGMKVYKIKQQKIMDLPFDNSHFDSNKSKVHSILKDNTGNFWLAIYQKGVMMIPAQPNSFKYIGNKAIDKNIIGSNTVTSLCRDHEGTLWVGTDNDGIYGITKDLKQKIHFYSADSEEGVPSTVFGLYEDSERNMWTGSFTKGMSKLERKTGHCTYIKELLDQDGNRVQRVYDFVEDKNKRLWIATMGAGLYYYELKTNKLRYPEKANKNSNKWINCLLYSKDNKLYTCTYDGVSCINLNSDEFITKRFLSGHIVFSIYEDKKGIIWTGTSDGLSSWNPKNQQLVTFTTENGLPSDAVYAIVGDGQDNLWISTNAGISQYNRSSHKFINYFVGDGLQENEFSKNASFKDANGTIWFGGTNGITYFNPQEITNPAKKWNIRITDFYLHNQPVRQGVLSGGREIINEPVFEATEFNLSHDDNSFTIEFSTLEMNNPERITYLYAMNDNNWVSLPIGNNKVSFSNLPPGTYHFKIKVQDYMVDSDVKEITIYVHAAWWASWWAKLIYALLTAGTIWFIVLQAKHRYRTKQEMLQHIHAEQINEAKLQFFMNISHEIRTPMSLIISPLQKLISTDSDPSRQKTYHTIYRNSERILRLINQLMDIRKIDKGQMSLMFRETDMVAFIQEICNTFAGQTVNKHLLTFHHELFDTFGLWIDPTNFDKVILNILSNAFKFTPEGGRVDIYIKSGHNEDLETPLSNYAEIIIADTGIGIAPEEIEHIFERFYQIRNHLNNSNIGTGIGLHLTRSLVELHHGQIHAENNPEGVGSRFVIRLPMGCSHLKQEELDNSAENELVYTPTEPIPTIEETGDEEDPKIRKKTKYRVLIVEDDEEIRRYLKQELFADYYILESSNGKEALNTLFKRKPDVVISDIMMPEMDGLTLCKKIKQNVNLNHIPVILLTAKTREEDNIEGLEVGADAYMTKPFHIEVLRKTVQNIISSRERLRNTFSGNQDHEDKMEEIKILSPDEKLMERVMNAINKNLSDPNLTVELIASEIGISRVHLHRKLKELTNQTTRDFIRNTRLKQAAILLTQKRYTMVEISDLIGFANPTIFSTAFKELYGVPPTKYMEEHLK